MNDPKRIMKQEPPTHSERPGRMSEMVEATARLFVDIDAA